MEKWQIVKSIYHKLIAKCPQGTYQNALTKEPKNYALRNKYGVAWLTHGNDTTVNAEYISCCNNIVGNHVRFLNFNSEVERKNAWESYLTKFARFCIAMDESTKLAPYMDDYSEPWTDERFVEFFGLTEDEWKVIDETIK